MTSIRVILLINRSKNLLYLKKNLKDNNIIEVSNMYKKKKKTTY